MSIKGQVVSNMVRTRSGTVYGEKRQKIANDSESEYDDDDSTTVNSQNTFDEPLDLAQFKRGLLSTPERFRRETVRTILQSPFHDEQYLNWLVDHVLSARMFSESPMTRRCGRCGGCGKIRTLSRSFRIRVDGTKDIVLMTGCNCAGIIQLAFQTAREFAAVIDHAQQTERLVQELHTKYVLLKSS
jgi:hypothetical protein